MGLGPSVGSLSPWEGVVEAIFKKIIVNTGRGDIIIKYASLMKCSKRKCNTEHCKNIMNISTCSEI